MPADCARVLRSSPRGRAQVDRSCAGVTRPTAISASSALGPNLFSVRADSVTELSQHWPREPFHALNLCARLVSTLNMNLFNWMVIAPLFA